MESKPDARNLVGTEIAGRFRIVELLGEGGAGQVYLAEHTVLEKRFAIKVLLEQTRSNPHSVERFRREALTTSRLHHPNIVRITDFGSTAEGRLYLVMEYVPGQSLEQLLEEVRPGVLPLPRALAILHQVCDAVQAAHGAGIVHRDLKPDNVVLFHTLLGEEQIKVLDFGLAKILESSAHITGKNEIFGTPDYMAPEQARGEPVDQRADVYSLGAMAYELLAGRPPICYDDLHRHLTALQLEEPPPLRDVRPAEAPALSEDLETLVWRCLRKDPGARPATVDELLETIGTHRRRLHRRWTAPVPVSQVRTLLRDTGEDGGGAPDHVGPAPAPTPPPRAPAPGSRPGGGLDTNRSEQAGRPAEAMSPPPGTEDVAGWYWDRAIQTAVGLCAWLYARGYGNDTLAKARAARDEAHRRRSKLEADLAAERAILSEPGAEEREREERLRGAIMDLSMARDRLVAGPAGAPSASADLGDLDYQIRVLETNLGELYREAEQRQHAQVETVHELEGYLALRDREVRDAEVRLVDALVKARPEPCPRDLQSVYADLRFLLATCEAVELVGE